MKTGLWTAFEAAAATGGALCARGGDPDRWIAEEWAADGISIDTRTLRCGEMFVALSDARDGHEFLQGAFEKGASAALVSRAPGDAPEGLPLLLVPDTLGALRDLAVAARQRNFGKRIAVTGSAGKTSTKEMMRAAFARVGRVHAAEKSFNNHWGVPLTLAALPMTADFGVFEIGMNHAGEITPLTRLVRPHAAVVTTVAPAHLEFFGTTEKIAEAKAEIFLGLEPGGVAILPADNEHVGLLARRAREAGAGRLLTFGASPDADVRLIDYATDGTGSRFAVAVAGRRLDVALGAPGRHQAMNALAVLAAGLALETPLEPLVEGLARFGAGAGRGAQTPLRIPGGRAITILDESYNANPASMAAAFGLLGGLRPRPGGRRIAVLGDMLELGEAGPALHAALAEPLVAAGVERLYVAGSLMDRLWEAAPPDARAARAETAADLGPRLLADLRDGDIVMVKGSNGSRVSDIVKFLVAAGATAES